MIGHTFRALTGRSALRRRLTKHFRGTPLQQIVTAARTFPTASRVDIQSALNDFCQKVAVSTTRNPFHYGT